MVRTPLYLILLVIPLILIYRNRLKNRDKRITISIILYCLSFSLIVLALAGFGIIREKSREYTVFILDISDSVSAKARDEATEIINTRLKEMSHENYAGFVLFGEEGMIEKNLQNNLRQITFDSRISGRSTNIEEAIYKAVGMFPDKGKRSIILFPMVWKMPEIAERQL